MHVRVGGLSHVLGRVAGDEFRRVRQAVDLCVPHGVAHPLHIALHAHEAYANALFAGVSGRGDADGAAAAVRVEDHGAVLQVHALDCL